ncbi:MAG TPA: CAP domain-containing protein [Nitrosopumilus sp.]|nr:CAP domain-containing protein [Nitrosopumilus sp.]
MNKLFTIIVLAGLGLGAFVVYSLVAPYYFSLNSAEEVELRIHDFVNESRNKTGAVPLQFDPNLAEIARAHSQDMIERNFYSHVNPDGLDATARAENVGYNCYKDYGIYAEEGLGENIAQPGSRWITPEDLAYDTVTLWFNSQEHRENMNERSYRIEGIGVAFTDTGKAYITQNLC